MCLAQHFHYSLIIRQARYASQFLDPPQCFIIKGGIPGKSLQSVLDDLIYEFGRLTIFSHIVLLGTQ